ncbi:L-serine ammonia-lyase [Thiohalophilus thiocyanatoxydans]|uniref:L-serine dehydratase n=1 Tax=Thiohalophilus thiocyanatoxydans TaxID=381308 RepID=A0A4R8J068_9GAMM|nr:L-serine ammonia-lyase [Thiohalophilus thiocyanatoxydans]TDY03677.1 L-serine ammonia-lyase [Thiohalophilus thiocyanatoxydans]
MFISVLDLFKIGIGPSSSHTMGPMVAAKGFLSKVKDYSAGTGDSNGLSVRCILKGSLAYTGKGHGTDRAVTLGLHGYAPRELASQDVDRLVSELWQQASIESKDLPVIRFSPATDIVFDQGEPLPEHPNGMIFELRDPQDKVLVSETCFSIGGGFVSTLAEISDLEAPLKMASASDCPYPFDSARSMLAMAAQSGLSIAQMKRANERVYLSDEALDAGLDAIWQAMRTCVETGLAAEGHLPGGLNIRRRARHLYRQLEAEPHNASLNDWLSAYAIAVNEENAAGHMVVTAPTNGAAGVIPAVLYDRVVHDGADAPAIRDYLLSAGAIGGIIKHRSSISGAEVGCQGEVGSAAAMAAAGLCALRGGTAQQIENAAEIALEHHLGMTCDPVNGLVQVPCIERNAFGAIKAHAAASLAIRESGTHFMPLDNCIAAMKQTGLEMSHKYKETALGGLAVSLTEC